MTITKPTLDVDAVRLVAIDKKTGKSKSMTIYESSPSEVISSIGRLLGETAKAVKPSRQKSA